MKFITIDGLIKELLSIKENHGNLPVCIGDKASDKALVPAQSIVPVKIESPEGESQKIVFITDEIFEN